MKVWVVLDKENKFIGLGGGLRDAMVLAVEDYRADIPDASKSSVHAEYVIGEDLLIVGESPQSVHYTAWLEEVREANVGI